MSEKKQIKEYKEGPPLKWKEEDQDIFGLVETFLKKNIEKRNTKNQYRSSICAFLNKHNIKSPDDIEKKKESMDELVQDHIDDDIKHTYKRKISVKGISTFLQYLVEEGMLSENPLKVVIDRYTFDCKECGHKNNCKNLKCEKCGKMYVGSYLHYKSFERHTMQVRISAEEKDFLMEDCNKKGFNKLSEYIKTALRVYSGTHKQSKDFWYCGTCGTKNLRSKAECKCGMKIVVLES